MRKGEMVYFSHEIDGAVYGAWYREISAVEVEVIGAGLIRRASFGGFDALSVARSILEIHVRDEKKKGQPVASLAVADIPLEQ